MSSAGFTGRTHLLSSERPNNIYQENPLVKRFFEKESVFPGRAETCGVSTAQPPPGIDSTGQKEYTVFIIGHHVRGGRFA